jgi:hypothetical protein
MLRLHLVLSIKLGHTGYRAHLNAVHSWFETTVRPVLQSVLLFIILLACFGDKVYRYV